ncbi:MAG: S41 family peptidase [Planctomyces sp.]|nr:S41 family peptidase [Planctomyces sp.]
MHPPFGLRSKSVWTYLAFAAIGWAIAFAVEAKAADTPLPATESAAIERAADFERSRQWVEAIGLYEKALKQWPENPQLKYGLRRTRIQFSVDRRYADRSYTDGLTTVSMDDALVFLDDALLKVRKYYVDAISPTAFIAHGTESLYIALANEKFIAKNASTVSPRTVTAFRAMLRDRYWNKPCGSTEEARAVVTEVARMAYSELRITPGATVMEYVFGGCNALDEYSSFLTPGRLDDLYNNIEGEFVGIGIEMKAEAGKGMLLINVLADSPAEEGGAAPGDFIVAIDGVNCLNMSTEEAAQHLQGAPDSRVRLDLRNPRTEQIRQAELKRRAVKVKSIPIVRIVDPVNGIGYIKMTGFQKNSAAELDAALVELRSQGMKALIWDLRGNPGGLLTAAVEVLDRFLDDGMIVSTKGRTQDQNWSYTATKGNDWNVPLAILVDGDSASASEIVAGAIHDHGRGVLVGRKTYGKWSVQSILPGRSSTGLRLTTAKFYSPNGNTYGKIGVEPDVAVAASEEQFTGYRGLRNENPEDDQDLAAGMNSLRRQLARR